MQEAIPYNIFENDKLISVEEVAPPSQNDSHNKRVLIYLLPYQSVEEHTPQIQKIFAACNIKADELLIINKDWDWSGIQAQEAIKEVFLFGVNPKNIGILYTLFPYKFLTISDKKVILADALDLIMGQAQLKNDFWHNCLKPYYVGA